MYQILILDDEPMAIKACQHALPWAEFGMNSTWGMSDPTEALDFLRTQMIDACFVDLRMPELDGFEFIQAARKIQPELLFIVLTGYDQNEFVRQAFRENVFDYCLKPIQRSEARSLLPRLEAELQKIRLTRDHIDFAKSHHEFLEALKLRMDPARSYHLIRLEIQNIPTNPVDAGFIRRILLSQMAGFHWVQDTQVIHLFIPERNEEPQDLQFESILNTLSRLKEHVSFTYRILEDPVNLEQLSLIWKTWISYGTFREGPDATLSMKKLLALQDDRIERALLEIHQNYAHELSLQKISSALKMNYTYFSELFSKATGLSFTQYLNGVRLSASKQLLASTDLSISDIAFQVGYNSEQYFSRLFRKHYEMSPSQYRKKVVTGEA